MGYEADWEDKPAGWAAAVNYGGNPNIKTLDPNMPYVQDNPDFRAGSRGALLGKPNNRNNNTAATAIHEYPGAEPIQHVYPGAEPIVHNYPGAQPRVQVNNTGLDWMGPALSLMHGLGAKVPEQAVPPLALAHIKANGVDTVGGIRPIDLAAILGSRVNPQNVAARKAAAQAQSQAPKQPQQAQAQSMPSPIQLPGAGVPGLPEAGMQQAKLDPSANLDQMPPVAPDFQRQPAPQQAPDTPQSAQTGSPLYPGYTPFPDLADANVPGQSAPPVDNSQAAFGSPYRVTPPNMNEWNYGGGQNYDPPVEPQMAKAESANYGGAPVASQQPPPETPVEPQMAKAESANYGGAPVASQMPSSEAPSNVRNNIGQRIFRPLQGGVQQQDLMGAAGDTTLRNGVQQAPLQAGIDKSRAKAEGLYDFEFQPETNRFRFTGHGVSNSTPEFINDAKAAMKEVERQTGGVIPYPHAATQEGRVGFLLPRVQQAMMRRGYRLTSEGRLAKSSRARLGA